MKLIQKMKCVTIAIIAFFFFYSGEYSFAEDPGKMILMSFYRSDYYTDDVVAKRLEPNVMILLDTSTAMTFSVNGVMPNAGDGRTKNQRAALLEQSTYGHGMRPPRFDGVETKRIVGGVDSSPVTSYSRYGRDLEKENNVIGSSDCYYTSDPAKPFLLTFRNIHLAHRTDWIDSSGTLVAPTSGNLAKSTVVGGAPNASEVKEALESWDAISAYVPINYVKDADGYWIPKGNLKACVPVTIANQHLVPNDSRIYKMKLALWRATGVTNGDILARMNIGVSITYQDFTRGVAVSVATKNTKPGAKPGERDYYGATAVFKHGNAAPYVTGETQDTTLDINGKSTYFAHMSQDTMRGVLVQLYNDQKPGDSMFNALSRSIMYVPFNKFYSMDDLDGSINPTKKLNDFRNYISGYESYQRDGPEHSDLNSAIPYKIKPLKDEFFASSLTLLSTAIYGGRTGDSGNHFPYHQGKIVTDSGQSVGATKEPMIQFAVDAKTNAGSTNTSALFLDPSVNTEDLPTGQAIGSVLDFFSPPPSSSTTGLHGVHFGSNSAGFFPVAGSCQANWLIVFCAGNDAVDGYPPAEAIRRLFNKTLTMRGRKKNGSSWEEKNYSMDSGVRTIVVGFLPEEKDNEEPEIAKIRKDIWEMARAGDPILTPAGVYIDNPKAEPEIASDVEGLVKALNNVLQRIHVDKQGSATVGLPPIIDNITDPDTYVVFGSSYRINNLDQWTGWLGKYILKNNVSTEQWEANRNMISDRLSRELYTFTNNSITPTEKVDAGMLETLANVPTAHSQKFSDWLLTYEYNPQIADSRESVGILGDMANSGITVVGRPKSQSLIDNPVINNRIAVVYVQTNRGVLHAFNYMNGEEIWGFIPPNIFQHKLRSMKIDRSNKWLDGNGYMRIKSIPELTLDGRLIARDVEYQNNTKTILTGYLGNGGNGFYAMDITEMDSSKKPPKFEWAIENARHNEPGPFSVDSYIYRWGLAAQGNESYYDYTDLGRTIVPGVYFTPANGNDNNTIGVLPGGIGYLLGADSQGKAFYFFNPTDGAIIKKIDSSSDSSTGFEAPNTRKLGMGISPIIYHENPQKKAIEFITADSEGNILKCDTDGVSVLDMKLKSIFQLRTLGSSSSYEASGGVIDATQTEDLAVAIPRKMILARSRNNYHWLFGGTSDLYVSMPNYYYHMPDNAPADPNATASAPGDSQGVYKPNSTASAPGDSKAPSNPNYARGLFNEEQFIFGLNTKNILASNELNNPGISSSNSGIRKLPYYADGMPSKYDNYGRPYVYDDRLGIDHGMDDYGWVLRLRPKIGDTDPEYLSTEPYLMNNVLYVATFIPYINKDSDEACSDLGVAKLYALDPSTGSSVILDRPAVMLENVKIAGITGNPSKDRLILSVKELVYEHATNEIFKNFQNPLDISLSNSLYEVNGFGAPNNGNAGDPEIDYEELLPHVQYWSERFKF